MGQGQGGCKAEAVLRTAVMNEPCMQEQYSKVLKVKTTSQQDCDLRVCCSSPFLGLEPALNMCSVLWATDHICSIICRYLPGFYASTKL